MCTKFLQLKFRTSRRIVYPNKLIKMVIRYRIELTGKQMNAPNVIISLQMLEALKLQKRK